METRQLNYALAVLETGSFAQAAKRCYTSRQNISHAIKMLELELGVTLFERKNNVLAPTEQGLVFLEEASSVVSRLDKMQRLFSADAQFQKRKFKLAVSMNLLSAVSKELSTVLLGGQLDLSEMDVEQCYESVCDHRADAAYVMSMKGDFPNCRSCEIGIEPSYLLIPEESDLARKDSASIYDIVSQNLMLMPSVQTMYRPLLAQLESFNYDISRINVVASVSTAIRLIKRGFGAAIVSEKYALDGPKGLVAVPIADSRLYWRFYYLCLDSSSEERMTECLLTQIKKAYREERS